VSPQPTRVVLFIAGLTVSLLCPGLRAAGDGDTGLWVRQATLVSPDAIDRLVEEASDAGFTTLLVEAPSPPQRRPPPPVDAAADGLGCSMAYRLS